VIFTRDNYANWNRLVTNPVRSENKLVFIDGLLIKLENYSLEEKDMVERDVIQW